MPVRLRQFYEFIPAVETVPHVMLENNFRGRKVSEVVYRQLRKRIMSLRGGLVVEYPVRSEGVSRPSPTSAWIRAKPFLESKNPRCNIPHSGAEWVKPGMKNDRRSEALRNRFCKFRLFWFSFLLHPRGIVPEG